MEINKREIKKILTEQRKDYQHYLGTFTESFESQVKLIAESVSGIQDQLIAIRDMVTKNTEDIEMIKINMGIIKSDLKEKVDRDEFAAFEKRLYLLEKKVQRI